MSNNAHIAALQSEIQDLKRLLGEYESALDKRGNATDKLVKIQHKIETGHKRFDDLATELMEKERELEKLNEESD